jgi:hypothetical protein
LVADPKAAQGGQTSFLRQRVRGPDLGMPSLAPHAARLLKYEELCRPTHTTTGHRQCGCEKKSGQSLSRHVVWTYLLTGLSGDMT